MKVVLDQFAAETPWKFAYENVTPRQWNTASFLSMPAPDTAWKPQPDNLKAVFNAITVERSIKEDPQLASKRQAQLEKLRATDPQAAELVERATRQHPDGNTSTGRPRQAAHRARPQRDIGQGYERS